MSDPKFMRKLAILVAVEQIVGTFVVPVAANAIEVSDVTLTPIEGDEVEQGIVRPYFGASESTLVTEYRKIAFSVGFAGVAAKGDIPGWAPLMRGALRASPTRPRRMPTPRRCSIRSPMASRVSRSTP